MPSNAIFYKTASNDERLGEEYTIHSRERFIETGSETESYQEISIYEEKQHNELGRLSENGSIFTEIMVVMLYNLILS